MRIQDSDRGATLVLVAIVSVVLLGLTAFAVDLGFGWAVKRQMSATADAGAIAGAQAAGLTYWPGNSVGCQSDGSGGLAPSAGLTAEIEAAVAETHSSNDPQGSDGYTVEIECADDGTAVTVRVHETGEIPTFFGQVLGLESLQPGAQAAAKLEGRNYGGGLRPLTFCVGLVDTAFQGFDPNDLSPTVYQSNFGYTPKAENGDASNCTPTDAPGNWGYTDFGGLGSAAPQVFDCLVEFGYADPDHPLCGDGTEDIVLGFQPDDGVTVPDDYAIPGDRLTANTGDSARLDAMMNDSPIYLPVADNWDDTGANAVYDAYGAVSVNVCGWAVPKNVKELTGDPTTWYKEWHPRSTGTGLGDCKSGWSHDVYLAAMTKGDGSLRESVDLVVQWEPVVWVQSGNDFSVGGKTACKLDDYDCRRSVYLIE